MSKLTGPLDLHLLKDSAFDVALKRLIHKADGTPSGTNKHPVVKGLSLRWILQHRKEIYQRIHKAIKADDFEFSPVKRIDLMTNGKSREIYVTNYADRILLMAMQDTLSKAEEPNHIENLFSFRKKQGPVVAARKLSQFLKETNQKHKGIYFLGRDVSSYGDSIDHRCMDDILQNLESLKDSPLILELFKKSYRIQFYHGEDSSVEMCLAKGIPSGSPVVPVLENLYLRSLDQKLSRIPDSFYARYGDDFIFLSHSLDQINLAEEIITDVTASLKLTISAKKKKNFAIGICKTADGFVKKNYFEWIGITFYPDGSYSFKPKHNKEYKNFYREQIGNFTYYLSQSGLDASAIESCMNSGFNEIHELQNNPHLQKMIVLRTHIKNSKLTDKRAREFLVKSLCKTMKISRREAWKKLRKMKLHSAEYQRRRMKCNRAA